MKKISTILTLLLLSAFTLQSCDDMDDKAVPVNDFIWKGLNLYYYWQPDVPDLADNRFGNQGELNSYLQGFSSPEALFNNLKYVDPTSTAKSDRFSVLVSDYNVLEAALQGVSKSNGVEYGLVYTDETQTSIFGYVRYILPDTDASAKDIQRGDIFYAVDGVSLTVNNYRNLLGSDTYTLNLADYNDGTVTPNGESVTLTKAQYAEDPVYFSDVVYNEGGKTIGYLMYNGFYSPYDAELNNAFGDFVAQGVNELVLDLRYNGGGSVRTATYLASMITGQQLEGQLFAKEQWNPKLQSYFEDNNPEAITNNFTSSLSDNTSINHLNLTRVYILATGSTASASELIINCLKPYVDVVVIGTTTIGKNVGSVTLYDSPDFSKNDVDPSHRYAMQPIVLKIVNKNGFGEYEEGIEPTIEMPEDYDNLGVIGSPDEPLLATAINQITAAGRMPQQPHKSHRLFKGSKNLQPFSEEMFIEEAPKGLDHLIKNLPQ
ncbi:S41 family peptidase [Flavobacterium beibuense]|nr:S41 family peptidase [Flavobacterium beibuense]